MPTHDIHQIYWHICACVCLKWDRQHLWSMAHSDAPRSAAMISIICCRRTLQPTPPTISTVSAPQWAMARSVISTSIANMVSCSEKQRSAAVTSPLSSFVFASFSMYVSSPLKLTSIPFTMYGSSTYVVPWRASCSMLYPGEGSLDRPSTRANRSRQLPTAMSIVSPKIQYLRFEYAITFQCESKLESHERETTFRIIFIHLKERRSSNFNIPVCCLLRRTRRSGYDTYSTILRF